MFEGLSEEQLPAALEAMLFVTDEPASPIALAQMLDVDPVDVTNALEALASDLEERQSGIQLREVSGGWRLYTHPAFHELLEGYVLSWDTRRMSQAALEVLAIVAYGQPITRAQIASVRGVTSDGPLNTLVERGYVREAGVADTPGNPTLYATTRTFLEKYGLRSVKDLPPLEEFAPDEKTSALIRERLGAPAPSPAPSPAPGGLFGAAESDVSGAMPDERDLPTPEQLVANATASLLGVVDKIDFDALTFDTDDE